MIRVKITFIYSKIKKTSDYTDDTNLMKYIDFAFLILQISLRWIYDNRMKTVVITLMNERINFIPYPNIFCFITDFPAVRLRDIIL
jgi:hypothetical protein